VRYIPQTDRPAELTSETIHELYASVPQADVESALAGGTLLGSWEVLNYERIAHGVGIPFMMMGLILVSMCIVIYVVVSLATAAPTEQELEQMGWRPPLKDLLEKKITGITDPRIIAVGLFVLMAVLYAINIMIS
jgi:SSS family solute:Na+ symporter